jgi:invasion protein IalB
MSSRQTHRIGRLRSLAVLSALAVSMVAGALPAAASQAADAPGRTGETPRQDAPAGPWAHWDGDGVFHPSGFTWR